MKSTLALTRKAAIRTAKAERKLAKAEARVIKAEAKLETKRAKLEAAKKVYRASLAEAEQFGAYHGEATSTT